MQSTKASFPLWMLIGLLSLAPAASALGQQSKQKKEEAEDIYKRWMDREVLYIISDEERTVFKRLTTNEERERFIEQFWRTRDPDLNTPNNEFREEHYRRVAFANENFAAGEPGWKTDRGMVYIKFGPPNRRETNPMGGRVFRSELELKASGRTAAAQSMTAMPFEVWEYRYVDGIGSELHFEFVSKDGTLNYELVIDPEEKDALFFQTGTHLRRLRGRNIGLQAYGGNDLQRLESFAKAFKPLPYNPPQEFVSTKVTFSELPFSMELVTQSGEQSGFTIDVQVPHSSLSFNGWGNGSFRAVVEVEIFIRDIRKTVVAHKSDAMETRLTKAELMEATKTRSSHSAQFYLPAGRYLVDVWIRDVQGDMSSTDQKMVIVPGTNAVNPSN